MDSITRSTNRREDALIGTERVVREILSRVHRGHAGWHTTVIRNRGAVTISFTQNIRDDFATNYVFNAATESVYDQLTEAGFLVSSCLLDDGNERFTVRPKETFWSCLGAINVEYILLIVVGALAVVFGLAFLSGNINEKYQQLAAGLAEDASAAPSALQDADISATMNSDGTFTISTYNNGIAPYELRHDGNPVDSNVNSNFIVPLQAGLWVIADADNNITRAVRINQVVDTPDADTPPSGADVQTATVVADSSGLTLIWDRPQKNLSGFTRTSFYALLDVDNDSLMESSDYLFHMYVRDNETDATLATDEIVVAYMPNVPTGDVIGGNGVPEMGGWDYQIVTPSLTSMVLNQGLGISAHIAWEDLGMIPMQACGIRFTTCSDDGSLWDGVNTVISQ